MYVDHQKFGEIEERFYQKHDVQRVFHAATKTQMNSDAYVTLSAGWHPASNVTDDEKLFSAMMMEDGHEVRAVAEMTAALTSIMTSVVIRTAAQQLISDIDTDMLERLDLLSQHLSEEEMETINRMVELRANTVQDGIVKIHPGKSGVENSKDMTTNLIVPRMNLRYN